MSDTFCLKPVSRCDIVGVREVEVSTSVPCIKRYTSASHERFVLYQESVPISGIIVWKDCFGGIIEHVYTEYAHRRKGLAKELLRIARVYIGEVDHNDNLTKEGQYWRDSDV